MAQTIVGGGLAALLAAARGWRQSPLRAKALLVLALAGTVLVGGAGLAVGELRDPSRCNCFSCRTRAVSWWTRISAR